MKQTVVFITIVAVVFSVASVLLIQGLNEVLEPYDINPWIWIGLCFVLIGLVPLIYKAKVLQRFWWVILIVGSLIVFFALIFG